MKIDFKWIILTSLLCTLWLYNGYNKGLSHNPKVEFVQLMRNTPMYAQGFKGSGWNYMSCDVKKMDYEKKEVILNKCNYKYIQDKDKEVIRRSCPDKSCEPKEVTNENQ